MLSDKEIYDIADQMNITCLQGCFYKDKLKYERFQPNKGYIINLQNSQDGNGTHFTLLYSQKNMHTNHVEYFYFDSTSGSVPEEVKSWTKQCKIPYNNKNIQGIYYNSSCGWFCLACLYMLSTYKNRLHDLYMDAEYFLGLFHDDLNQKFDLFNNEKILKRFFQHLNVKESLIKRIK